MSVNGVFEIFWRHVPVSWRQARMDISIKDLPVFEPKSLIAFALTLSFALFIAAYRYISPILPVRVQCWFCGGINKLPVANKNHFDCQHCEQYNGFSALGDYNKDIPAQREATMNVFSVGAAPSGKTLSMYHNGLCELCNHRQTIKMQLRNQFEARDPRREEAEFEEYCRQLEKIHGLCTVCKNHVRTRLAYQDAKLLPHVMAIEAAFWSRRIQRLFNSEFSELLVWVASVLSFSPVFSEGWPRLAPLALALPLMLLRGVHNSALLWCTVLRGVSIALTTTTIGPIVTAEEGDRSLIQTALNGISMACGIVGVFAPLQIFVARISGRKRSLFESKFTTLPNLTKALAPLISPAHRAFVRSYRMITRAPFDLEPRINSLKIGTSSRISSSPGLGMSASTFGAFDQTTTPRSYSDFMGRSFGTTRTNIDTPEPFQFGKPRRSPGAASSITRTASVLRPSRLSDIVGGKHEMSQGLSPQSYGGTYANLTPPPSQDSSLSASEDFISASRHAKSFYSMPRSQETGPDLYNGLVGLTRTKSDRKDWDSRTSRTQHTAYSTVVHQYNGSANKALWVIAFLLAVALAKLCWLDFVRIANAVYSVTSSWYLSPDDAVCPVR